MTYFLIKRNCLLCLPKPRYIFFQGSQNNFTIHNHKMARTPLSTRNSSSTLVNFVWLFQTKSFFQISSQCILLTCSDRERHPNWATLREIFYCHYGQSTCPYACKIFCNTSRLGSPGWSGKGIKFAK